MISANLVAERSRSEVVLGFHRNRWVAHSALFRARHRDASPLAHHELVRRIYDPAPRYGIEGFRGFAKSTYLEEAAIVRALFGEYHNMVIVGASYAMACDRLRAIKHQLEYNEMIHALFGPQVGDLWQEGKIVLRNGIAIQALGRNQAMTGMKHLDWRPDAALVDDVEDPEETRTDAERAETWRWFLTTFLPALDHPLKSWVRVLGTRRGKGSLPERIETDGWPVVKFPIEYQDEKGERRATWPSKFPLAAIDQMRRTYARGETAWMQEFMCVAVSAAHQEFRGPFRVEPKVRAWQAVYAMIDPARTTNRTSATTGWAVWSWIGRRLHVWASGAKMLKPDEIIDLAFAIGEEFNPVLVGVEEDGLNEFILQPLRHEQVRRRRTLPVRGVRAPRGKLDFIRGLQPFFAAGEITFNAEFPELEAQLLGFPSGRIDAPNALAYALTLRPAGAVYEPIPAESIVDDAEPDPSRPLYLAANSTGSYTAAVLLQFADGVVTIVADWVVEGPPADAVEAIHAEACLVGDAALRTMPARYDWTEALKVPRQRVHLARQAPTWVVPPKHGETWSNVGLEQEIRRQPARCIRGTDPADGRAALRERLGRARPAVVVAERAAWTLRAFAGGYARGIRKNGLVSPEAEDGPYKVLMEGLEAFVGMMASAPGEDDDEDGQPVAYDRRGVPYRSVVPQRH